MRGGGQRRVHRCGACFLSVWQLWGSWRSPRLPPSAGPSLLFDARTGQVIESENPFARWFPASLTKLMTTYVAFRAVEAGEVTLQSPVRVSRNAANEPPSKMGYQPGTILTLDNALKIIMVKSANDVATSIGESLAGSEEAWAARMNAESQRLGMTGSHWVNAHGLHDDNQYTTARDLGDPRLGAAARVPAICELFLDRGPRQRQAGHPQPQQSARPLRRRRRHEDRLHLPGRLQSRRLGDARRPHADGDRHRRHVGQVAQRGGGRPAGQGLFAADRRRLDAGDAETLGRRHRPGDQHARGALHQGRQHGVAQEGARARGQAQEGRQAPSRPPTLPSAKGRGTWSRSASAAPPAPRRQRSRLCSPRMPPSRQPRLPKRPRSRRRSPRASTRTFRCRPGVRTSWRRRGRTGGCRRFRCAGFGDDGPGDDAAQDAETTGPDPDVVTLDQ